MDGWAVRFADLATGRRHDARARRRVVRGQAARGRGRSGRGRAHLHRRRDARRRRHRRDAGAREERDGRVTIAPGAVTKAGQNRRFAGEDLKAGGVVFRRGQPLRARRDRHARVDRHQRGRRLPQAASSRSSRPATSCVSIGSPLAAGQVYDSNRYTIGAMLARLNCEAIDMGVVTDDPAALERAFRDAAANGRRRDHVGRRVGRRGRLRQAAARPARRGRVLEDRDEARAAARVRPDRRRALLRPARQSGERDGHVLPVRARRAAGAAGTHATIEPVPTFKATLARADPQGARSHRVPARHPDARATTAAGRCARPATRAPASCRRCRGPTASSCSATTSATWTRARASTCSRSKA